MQQLVAIASSFCISVNSTVVVAATTTVTTTSTTIPKPDANELKIQFNEKRIERNSANIERFIVTIIGLAVASRIVEYALSERSQKETVKKGRI
ncbi:MAG: hypothetical protein AAGI45_15980 [Cyanobacteria bacterium P01_H01_bin.26]